MHGYDDQFAVARTKRGEKKSYSGVSMAISVHDPEVRSPQFSSSRMHVQIGDDFIQAGWTVSLFQHFMFNQSCGLKV